jgi:hypothetical protein
VGDDPEVSNAAHEVAAPVRKEQCRPRCSGRSRLVKVARCSALTKRNRAAPISVQTRSGRRMVRAAVALSQRHAAKRPVCFIPDRPRHRQRPICSTERLPPKTPWLGVGVDGCDLYGEQPTCSPYLTSPVEWPASWPILSRTTLRAGSKRR